LAEEQDKAKEESEAMRLGGTRGTRAQKDGEGTSMIRLAQSGPKMFDAVKG